jgi:hypothetical protein
MKKDNIFQNVNPVTIGCMQNVPHQIDTRRVDSTPTITSNCVEADGSLKMIVYIRLKEREKGYYTLSSDDLGLVHRVVSAYM